MVYYKESINGPSGVAPAWAAAPTWRWWLWVQAGAGRDGQARLWGSAALKWMAGGPARGLARLGRAGRHATPRRGVLCSIQYWSGAGKWGRVEGWWEEGLQCGLPSPPRPPRPTLPRPSPAALPRPDKEKWHGRGWTSPSRATFPFKRGWQS